MSDTLRNVRKKRCVCITALLLGLLPLGCAATDDYVEVPAQPFEAAPIVEQTVPPEIRAALQTCAKARAAHLSKHSYEATFEIQATARGEIEEIKPKGNRLDDADLETCMTNALKSLPIREYLPPDDSLMSPADPQSALSSSRALLGTTALLPQAIRLVPIVITAPGGITIVVAVAIVMVAVATMSAECQEEWRKAKDKCADMLEWNDVPRGVTGGYVNTKDCARGLVHVDCGGNRTDDGDRGARPGRRT